MIYRYNERISFDLPERFQYEDEVDDDGNRVVKISLKDVVDAAEFFVNVITADSPAQDILDKAESNYPDSILCQRVGSDPVSLLMMSDRVPLLGIDLRFQIYRMFVRMDAESALMLGCMYTKVGHDSQTPVGSVTDQLMEVLKHTLVDGRLVTLPDVPLSSIVKKASVRNVDQEKARADNSAAADGTNVTVGWSKGPNAGQYRGIHQVTGQTERVYPYGALSVQVPPGFSYTMDKTCNGTGHGGKYILQIQSSEDYDFSKPYESRFNLLLLPIGMSISLADGLTDLTTAAAMDAVDDMLNKADERYDTFKHTADIMILKKDEAIRNGERSIWFMVFTRGCTYVSRGLIIVRDRPIDKAEQEISNWLNGLDVATPQETDEYRPISLTPDFGFSFQKKQTHTFSDGVTVPIPDGFKASADPSRIGFHRALSIIEQDCDDYERALFGRMGLTILRPNSDIPYFDKNKIGNFMKQLFQQVDLFDSTAMYNLVQMTTDAMIVYQWNSHNTNPACLGARALIWVRDAIYIINFSVNYTEPIRGRYDAIRDICMIAQDWLNRVQLPGRRLYGADTGRISTPVDNQQPSFIPDDEESDEDDFEIVDGALFGYIGSGGHVVIPHSVTSIEDWAFSDCDSVTSVIIPDSVTSIGDRAFADCTGLTSVTIPDSVTSIGDNAFGDCTSLTNVMISDGVTSIGDFAFDGCTGLTSVIIPDSVTSIGDGAFMDCTSLTSVTIPDSVKSIGDHVFQRCTSLTNVMIPDGVTSIGECAFDGCTELSSVTVPDSVVRIGNWAFDDCFSLSQITIPEGISLGANWHCDETEVLYRTVDGEIAKALSDENEDEDESEDSDASPISGLLDGLLNNLRERLSGLLGINVDVSVGDDDQDGNGFPCRRPPDILHEHFDLVESGSYASHRDADFVAQPLCELMKGKHGVKDMLSSLKVASDIFDPYELDETAVRLAKVFRLEEQCFDPYTDQEAMIRKGMFKKVSALHALRSLAWTVGSVAERDGRELADFSFDELTDMGDFIEAQDRLNYDRDEHFATLCSQYDWHVFYVTDSYIADRSSGWSSDEDLRRWCRKENRGGNTMFGFFGGDLSALHKMRRVNSMIERNEETLDSLEGLRKDLQDLLPLMETIHDGLLADRNREERLEGLLADALCAWCALAIAAKEPFYTEEATDSPEANAGMDEPLQRPRDRLDDSFIHGQPATAARGASAGKKAIPKGDVLDLHGAAVIEPGQFVHDMSLKNIVIPEGVTEIGERAFYYCTSLESVIFPRSLKKICSGAFMGCSSLRHVELQEGLEELGTHAFGATSSLKEIHLPDSLQRTESAVFGMGGDSPYATAYMSGKLAARLKKSAGNSLGIYARRYVIDGKPYDSLRDYEG